MQKTKSLPLEDAMRMSGPLAFNIMLKPAGSLCNLDCSYCYYLDKAEIYGGREPRMSVEMLETVVKEYIAANDVPEVTFNWHGGEPLVMGLDFYRKAIEFEHKYAGEKIIRNTLQTNGTLISSEWCRFLRENDFLVGISIDGPKDIHDRYRRDKGGAPTFDKVLNAIRMMQGEGVQFNTMSTVNKQSEGRGLEVYEFLKSIGSQYMQFMPVVEHVRYRTDAKGKPMKGTRPWIVEPSAEGAQLAPWSVSAIGFGKFLCQIFDYWIRHDVGTYFVNVFDCTLANWVGVTPGSCVYGSTCGSNSIIEHNGDLYCCDHFVYPEYKVGNISEKPLKQMMQSEQQMKFGVSKHLGLPYKCLKCKYLFACNGECPKHRFNSTEKGETGLNALCEGYCMFFDHAAPYMQKMSALLNENKSPALVMMMR